MTVSQSLSESGFAHSAVGKALRAARRSWRDSKGAGSISGYTFDFTDRSKGSDRLCMIVAGYKKELWDIVFDRINAFAPADLDICIVTSGLVVPQLQEISERYGWSYLSTSVNHLSLVQNLAIEQHPKAKWIYKVDEDMFITSGFFEKTLETYRKLEDQSLYRPAFVSPLINVNCYGHLRLLDKLGLMDDFRKTGLTDMKYTDGLNHNRNVIDDPRVAEYLWGSTQPELRDIDALTEKFSSDGSTYSICPIRYSIGAILYRRETWEKFEHWPLTFVGSSYGLGDDEEHICSYACMHGLVMAVDERVLVGHLGYGGGQTKAMIQYFLEHKSQFALKEAKE